MKIINIFENCLFSVEYSGSKGMNEFKKVFNFWSDVEKLHDFFEKNNEDLIKGYYGAYSIDEAVIKTILDADEFEQKLYDLSKKSTATQIKELNSIFKPLSENQDKTIFLNKSKAKQSWLRIYALKTEDNDYIVTGGAIKLTATMDEKTHTKEELKKLKSIRKYLLDRDIKCTGDIVEAKEF